MAPKTPQQAAAKAARKQKKTDAKEFRSLAASLPKGVKALNMAPDLIGTDDVLGHYAASCISPFDGSAVGARVPAPYECRTVTAKLHTLFSPQPATGGDVSTYGFSVVLTASPIGTLLTHSPGLRGVIGGANCNFQAFNANQSYTPSGAYERFVNISGYDFSRSATTAANLAKLFSQYRVVSCGFRVRVESSLTNTQGRLLIARAPAGPVVPLTNSSYWGSAGFPLPAGTAGEIDDGELLASCYAAMGFPWQYNPGNNNPGYVAGDISDTILSFPDSMEVSLPSIMDSGFELLCPKTSALHTQFIHAQASGEYSVGEQSIVAGDMVLPGSDASPGLTSNIYSGHASTVPRVSDNSTAGFTNVALKFIGLGVGTQVSIETIFHLEGTPASYDVTDPTMPIPTSLKPAFAMTAHVDEVNAITGSMPMGRPADSPHIAVEHMLTAASTVGTSPGSRVGGALRNAGGALLNLVPGGGIIRSAGTAINNLTGGKLGQAIGTGLGNMASSVMNKFRSFFGR